MGRPNQSKDSKARKRRRLITPSDLEAVRENLPNMSVKQLAAKMGISESTVKRLARKCQIKKIGAIKEVLMEQTCGVCGVFLLRKRFSSESDKVFLGYSDDIYSLLEYYSQSFPQFNFTNYAIYILEVLKPNEEEIVEAYRKGLGKIGCNSIGEFFAS
jgi:predicted DNA-binding protein (UPF0251 family)